MRTTDFFVKYDRRRERWQVTFVGWLLVSITVLMGLAALAVVPRAVRGLGLLRAAQETSLPAPVSAPPAAVGGATPVTRPGAWTVWEERVGDTVRYHAPDEVRALVMADFRAAGNWWQANLGSPDVLEAGVADYYSGPMVETMRQEVARLRQQGEVRLIYAQDPPPDGRAPIEITTFTADGQEVYLNQVQGASESAVYHVADGTLVPGSRQAASPVQATYRLAFDAASRRWKVHELLYAGALR